VDLASIDVVVAQGDQLGLVLFGASPHWLVTIDGTTSQYDVDLGTSSLTLPVVGSVSFAGNAGDPARCRDTCRSGCCPIRRH
jgi:hypothetical protein